MALAEAQASPDRQVERRRIVVFGVVQGVGYRYFAQRVAGALGLVGWVRNLPDGSVELVAEGEPQLLEALSSRLREGPRGARVSGMEVTEFAGGDILDGFEIR